MIISKRMVFGTLLSTSLMGTSIGCANMNHTGNGALAGGGIGALIGGIIGHQTGNTGAGAAIGAATGALAGGVIGNAEDARDERNAAVAHASHMRAQRDFERQALSNSDIVVMTSSGVGDPVIINSINTRGGRFDTTPAGIISLKQQGVSDTVIAAMQTAPNVIAATPRARTIIADPGPDVIYVQPPPPRVGVFVGPRPYRYRHYHRW